MHNTLKKSSENEDIYRTTSSSVPLRSRYSRELLIHLRSTPPSKEVPAAAFRNINLFGLQRRFRGRRGGRRHHQRHQHQQHKYHEKWRQPSALPDTVGIPVRTTTSRLCRPTGPTMGPAQGYELRRANRVEIVAPDIAGRDKPTDNIGTQVPGLYIINACSISKPYAIEQLRSDLVGYGLAIAIITEIHLKSRHSETAITMEGYNMFRRDRNGRRNGGVAIAVEDTWKASEFKVDGDNRQLELLWIRAENGGAVVFVGALYHPPKLIYTCTEELIIERLEHTVNTISCKESNANIVLGGDFNMLPENKVIEATSFLPLVHVHTPTRLGLVLDRLFVSEPMYEKVKIVTSTIKTDHKAIIATATEIVVNRNETRKKVKYRKRTPNQHASFLHEIRDLTFSDIEAETHPQLSWDMLYADIKERLDRIYP